MCLRHMCDRSKQKSRLRRVLAESGSTGFGVAFTTPDVRVLQPLKAVEGQCSILHGLAQHDAVPVVPAISKVLGHVGTPEGDGAETIETTSGQRRSTPLE